MARRIRALRYPGASVVLVAGSVMRGDATSSSDLDLVVVFEQLAHAHRETFDFDGWTVEAFVHDPETMTYFFLEVDRPAGFAALPTMVLEGVEVPEGSALAVSLKKLATRVLELGPPKLEAAELARRRYALTELVNDLRTPRSRDVLLSTGALLYGELGDFHLRSQGLWSGRGKQLPRQLFQESPAFFVKFRDAFDLLFTQGETAPAIALCEEALAPQGGLLTAGYRRDAVPAWRRRLPP